MIFTTNNLNTIEISFHLDQAEHLVLLENC